MAVREDGPGAVAADYPDLEPPPPNLHLQMIQPRVEQHPHDPSAGLVWVAYDAATGERLFTLGPEHQGKAAASLAAGTKAAPFHLWQVDAKDGETTIGSVGAENAGQMWDTARREQAGGGTPGAPPGGAGGAFKAGGGVISSGARLAEVQACLSRPGYQPGPADGIIGPHTRSAVVAFQRDHGLAADGIIGPQTQGALAAATA